MSKNMQNRQKKLAKKKAKRKAKIASIRATSPQDSYLAESLRQARGGRIIGCRGELADGMASIFLARSIDTKMVAMAAFNVDLLCLGVKKSYVTIMPRTEYDSFTARHSAMDPADAKKLIEGSIEFAENYGFTPRGEFKRAFSLLHDVDSSESKKVYEFGRDGRPLFVAGPFDSPAKCRAILERLEKFAGEDDYGTILPADNWDEENGEWESNREIREATSNPFSERGE